MKKRVLAMLLSVTMVASVLAGCGGSGGAANDSPVAADDSQAASGDSASVDSGETVKLKALFIAHPLTKDVNEMQWLAEMEAEANVEIEWEVIRADWETVKSTRFAAGDIPDLLFNATLDEDYTKYNGLFLDMTPYLTEELTPNILAMFEEEPDTKVLSTTMEGKIYGTRNSRVNGRLPTQ